MHWRIRGTLLDLTRRARVMGILNTTPDSFSDGGRHPDTASALAHARQMIAEGAEIIDIGGESTRPGAPEVSTEEELARTTPVVEALRAEWGGLISIDTVKAAVARAALAAGADIINDVSGLRRDAGMAALCRETGCGVVVMHMQGTPRTMQDAPCYEDVAGEVAGFFLERLRDLTALGLDPETLCFDPGIGFGKTLEHNLILLERIGRLAPPGRPLMLGLSRKSFIGRVLGGRDNPGARDLATATLGACARRQGVMLHRVHAVGMAADALRLTEAVMAGVSPG